MAGRLSGRRYLFSSKMGAGREKDQLAKVGVQFQEGKVHTIAI